MTLVSTESLRPQAAGGGSPLPGLVDCPAFCSPPRRWVGVMCCRVWGSNAQEGKWTGPPFPVWLRIGQVCLCEWRSLGQASGPWPLDLSCGRLRLFPGPEVPMARAARLFESSLVGLELLLASI